MTSLTLIFSVGIFLGHSIYCIVGQEGSKGDPDAFQEEANQIYSTIFHKYNERVRPPDNFPKPVLVTVEATLYHIRSVDIYKQEMESLLDLEVKWRDKRLAWYPYQVSDISANITTVWSPDVVYLNGAVPPRAMFNRKVGIQHDGMITWNRREAIITMCRTQPGNTNQTCDINLGFVSPSSMEAFSNFTSFQLALDFDNHNWDVYDAELMRNSDTDISLVVYLSSKSSGSGNGMVDGKNCSVALKYGVKNGSANVTIWTSLMCFLIFVVMLGNKNL